MQNTISNNSQNSSFRDKQTKYTTYINSNKGGVSTTLDNKHQEKINEFDNQDDLLLKKKKKHRKLLKELEELNSIKSIDLNNNIIDRKAEVKTEIENLELDINRLENRTNELDYYDETMDILLEYYNPTTKPKQTNDNNVISIKDVFKKKDIDPNAGTKSKLYEKYMKIVHNTNVKKSKNTHTAKICAKCKIEKTIHLNDGHIICTLCGDSDPIELENDRSNNKDSNADYKACAYKRANHLSEMLNQFQAKESTEIDEDIYKSIRAELKIQRIYDYSTLDHKIMKKILKKLKLNKYYEHRHHIINNLNGRSPPNMTREQEENIKKMFKDIQKPFSIYRPKKRKNFLNYNYIIHKICELHEYDEFLPFFPLLKSRVNLEEQDIVWEKICAHNRYQFIPSI
jgi:uncharacterized Zn finger protein (UPF0148 family)